MAQLTIRKVPEEVVRALKIRAAQQGRSAEAELRLILQHAMTATAADFWAQADALRGQSGRQRHESGRLLREMRDQR